MWITEVPRPLVSCAYHAQIFQILISQSSSLSILELLPNQKFYLIPENIILKNEYVSFHFCRLLLIFSNVENKVTYKIIQTMQNFELQTIKLK